MITSAAADGTAVRAFDEGSGPVILIIHPGLTAEGRGRRCRRGVRRQYRLDLPALCPYSIDREVEAVLALALAIGEPMVMVGHSSGGVVALGSSSWRSVTIAAGLLYS
jgi:pimeloyl-ACP methyl ester carboxylesterase